MSQCECPIAGYCERHHVTKNEHWHKLCQREDYFQAWEEGRGPGQTRAQKKHNDRREKNEMKPHPRWVRLLQRLSTPEDIGLGATAKRLASKFGGERFKAWRTKLGMPCKCGAREAEWNRLYPNPNYKRSDVGL